MVAILTVFACHLWGWPSGGFVGVDVFFVISGFLITGNLLRMADTRGNVSFKQFYWNRLRRIVPAATVVLILTYVAAVLVFLPFRSREVGIDAIWAFLFVSNWRFAIEGTDYFQAAKQTVSPLQHYWSLSIEEQFYFVWPALIFLIGLIVARRAWTHGHRMRVAGIVMAGIIALSLGWAIYETAAAPTWAYFNTFARVWELGTGALLATAAGTLARIPVRAKPVLSWAGLALIAASLVLISDNSIGFPAPWAILPVSGAALVIAAGVGGEPTHQHFLRNPVSTYIGDISYSLYLVHWPIIVIVGTLMDPGPAFSITVLAAAFGLAVASYHFVENPLRKADRTSIRNAVKAIRTGRMATSRSTANIAVGVVTLLVISLGAYAVRPDAYENAAPPAPLTARSGDPSSGVDQKKLGPLNKALQDEIAAALQATEWPDLQPSMDAVLNGPMEAPEVADCGQSGVDPGPKCTWGNGPKRIVVVGDSLATSYTNSLRELPGVQVHSEALLACGFINALIKRASLKPECDGRKQHAIEFIKSTKPDVVVITDSYKPLPFVGSDRDFTPDEWVESMTPLLNEIRGSVGKIVFMAPPPSGVHIRDCYATRASKPPACVGRVPADWEAMAKAEQQLAESVGGVWMDSRPWFCSAGGLCPSFVGTTPVMYDDVHMSYPYGNKIAPVIGESLREAAVI